MPPFDCQDISEIKAYDLITDVQKFIFNFLNQYLDFDDIIANLKNRDLYLFTLTYCLHPN